MKFTIDRNELKIKTKYIHKSVSCKEMQEKISLFPVEKIINFRKTAKPKLIYFNNPYTNEKPKIYSSCGF